MFRTMLISTFAALTLFAATACKKGEGDAPSAGSDVKRDVAATKQDLAQTRADFQKALEERIARLEVKIDELERRGDAKSKEAAAAFRARRDAAKAKLATISERTESNWDEFKTDVSNGWEKLEKDVDSAIK